jgi:type VI protein secretion system component VasF
MKHRIPFAFIASIAAILFVTGCSGIRSRQHVAADSEITTLPTLDQNNPSNWYDLDPGKLF